LLPSFFSSEDWKRRHAALVTIAQIAEGSAKVMIKNLEQVVGMVLNSFQDPHPRVRWAAINAVGQLSTDLGPELQNQLHHVVLPALASAMDDVQNPRVQASELLYIFFIPSAHAIVPFNTIFLCWCLKAVMILYSMDSLQLIN
jgi:HEAT repeat protein